MKRVGKHTRKKAGVFGIGEQGYRVDDEHRLQHRSRLLTHEQARTCTRNKNGEGQPPTYGTTSLVLISFEYTDNGQKGVQPQTLVTRSGARKGSFHRCRCVENSLLCNRLPCWRPPHATTRETRRSATASIFSETVLSPSFVHGALPIQLT